MVNGFQDQIDFLVAHQPSDKRIPATWFFNCRDAHNWIGMILVGDEIVSKMQKERRARGGTRRGRIKL